MVPVLKLNSFIAEMENALMDELHQIWLVLEDEWAESTGHRRPQAVSGTSMCTLAPHLLLRQGRAGCCSISDISIRMGLLMYPSMLASRHFSRSPPEHAVTQLSRDRYQASADG